MTTSVTSLDAGPKRLPAGLVRAGWLLLAAGLVVAAAAYAVDPRRAAFNNVILLLFLGSIAGGSVFLLALEYIAGAVWSVPTRRVPEFLAGLTPLLPLVALPLAFMLHDVYHWTHAEAVAEDALLQAKEPYLNVQFFLIRAGIVFAAWMLFGHLFVRNSTRQDTTRDPKLTTRNIRLAAIFLPVFALTLTAMAVDWGMSLEPHWYSTIYGVYYFSGTVLAALATATLVIVTFQERGLLPSLTRDHLYSLGALLFAFVNFWAYIAFSQFLLIWYANLPEETFWFIARWKDGWQAVSIALIVVHFAVPYFVLLPQDAKMDPRRLKFMAVWILAAHLLDLYWLVMPTFAPEVTVGWMELGFPLVAAGLVVVLLSFKVRRHNLVPIGDPKLERGLGFRL